jgi:hypothetical protein
MNKNELIIYIYILTLLLFACNEHSGNTEKSPKDTLSNEVIDDSVKTTKVQTENQNEISYNESDILPADSLFRHLELELTEITAKEFDRYARLYKTNCKIDSSGFIAGYGISLSTECHEICITTLIDKAAGKLMQLPCTYDQGISGITFSPSCDQFVSYSCYDGPDYDKYYEYRS